MKKAVKRMIGISLSLAMSIGNLPAADTIAALAAPQASPVDFPEVYPQEALEKELGDEELSETIDALLNTMTEDEKFSFLGGQGTGKEGNAGFLNGVPRLGIPQAKMYDGPAGVLSLHETTNPPQEQMLAATWDKSLAYKYGKIHGSENRAIGGNMQLGAQLDILRSPYFGRGKDQMGEDPYLLSQLAPELVKGIQDQHVMAVGKHYAAFAINASPGTKTDVKVSEQALRETYLPGFEAAVTKGSILGMMSAYNKINGVFASAHSELQNDILRKDWGFQGFTITDWGGNDGMTLRKGTDIEMPSLSNNSKESLEKAVRQGKISSTEAKKLVNDALAHILTAYGKAGYLGLVEIEDGKALADPTPPEVIRLYQDEDEARANLEAVREENNAFSQEIAEKGGVLLKNEDNTLPLTDDISVAVIGRNGMHLQSGIGGEASNGTRSEMVSPYAALEEIHGNVTGAIGLDALGSIIPIQYLYTASSSEIQAATKTASSSEIGQKASDSNIVKKASSTNIMKKATPSDIDSEDDEDISPETDALLKAGHGVTRTYGAESAVGGMDFFQGQGHASGEVKKTLMEGHELGEYAGTDAEINFTTGSIDGKPNRYYVSDPEKIEKYFGESVSVADASSFAKDSGAAYTWTTYLQAPETGEYSLILGGIGGSISGSVKTLRGKDIGSFSISNLNQGTQGTNEVTGETGTLLSSITAKLEKDQFYKVELRGVAFTSKDTGMDKDMQLTLSWITPSQKEKDYQDALDAAESCDVSIVFAYRKSVDLGKTRAASSLALDKTQEKLIRDVAKKAHDNGNKVVVVLNNPTAVTMKNWINKVDAVLEMYYPGQRGGIATARLLTGEINPSGKLAFTIPADDNETADTITEEIFKTQEVGEMVMPNFGAGGPPSMDEGNDKSGGSYDYYEGILNGYKWYDASGIDETLVSKGITQKVKPLYDFGYGLSYTSFAYSDLSVKAAPEDSEEAGYDASFTITNTGETPGADVAQLYLGKAVVPDSVQMAQYALAGFFRTEELQPGESTEVTVHLDQRSLSYWDSETNRWTIAKGERTLYVAHSSSDEDLEEAVSSGMTKLLSVGNDKANENGGSKHHIGGSGHSMSGRRAVRSISSNTGNGDRSGSWSPNADGRWTFMKEDGSGPKYRGEWAFVYNPYVNESGWFRFNEEGWMATGWFRDADGRWYFLDDGSSKDGKQGTMYTGWKLIDGKYYYFNAVSDGTKGALLQNTTTPDGYKVDASGVWIP